MLFSTKGVATAVTAAMAAPIFAASAWVSSVDASTFPCDEEAEVAGGSSGDTVVAGETAFAGGVTPSVSSALGCMFTAEAGGAGVMGGREEGRGGGGT